MLRSLVGSEMCIRDSIFCVDNKKINLEEQKPPQTDATVTSTSTSTMPNDSMQIFLSIFDKRESVQNGGFFPFFSNCNVNFNVSK